MGSLLLRLEGLVDVVWGGLCSAVNCGRGSRGVMGGTAAAMVVMVTGGLAGAGMCMGVGRGGDGAGVGDGCGGGGCGAGGD